MKPADQLFPTPSQLQARIQQSEVRRIRRQRLKSDILQILTACLIGLLFAVGAFSAI